MIKSIVIGQIGLIVGVLLGFLLFNVPPELTCKRPAIILRQGTPV